MGIVEDEEFNRKRRERRKMTRVKELELEEYDEPSDEVWCCTKVAFFVILTVFLTCSLLVITNYKEDDTLGLRMVVQEDLLGISRLAGLLDTDRISHGLKIRDLSKIPGILVDGLTSLMSQMQPVLEKLWYFIEQKWLTPTMRVYKDNFPFLKQGEQLKDLSKEEGGEINKEVVLDRNVKESHTGEEKIKDFKKMQDRRKIIDNGKKPNTEKKVPDNKSKEKKLKDDFGSFV